MHENWMRPDKMYGMAKEWAKEIGKLSGIPYGLIAEHISWGFVEVEKGRHPDVVLREAIAKIKEKHDEQERNKSDIQAQRQGVGKERDKDVSG